MVTDTFFDLQRFADDTLVGSNVNGGTFTWQKVDPTTGAKVHTFVNDGTAENPVYHLDTTGAGTTAVTGSAQIAFHGTRGGYSFTPNGDKSNWEVALQGSNNVVAGDFSQGDAAYGLNGEATVKVYAGRSFNESLNGSTTYVKAANGADVPVTVSSDGTTAIDYTLSNANAAAVVIDSNDTAVFTGSGAAEMTLGTAATPDAQAASIPGVQFSGDASVNASVTSDNINLAVAVKDSVAVSVAGDRWTFTNKSTRDNATLVVDSNTGEVTNAFATKGVTVLANDDGIEAPVNVNGTQWDAIIASTLLSGARLPVFFDESGNATISNIVYDATEQEFVPRNNGGVTVNGAAGATAEFATITATGVIANGAKIQADAYAEDIKVTLEADGISAIKMDVTKPRDTSGNIIDPTDYTNDPDGDGPITISGDANKTFDVQAEEDIFSVNTTADSIAVDVNRVISTGTGTDNDPRYLYVNGNALHTTVDHNQSYTVTGGEAVYQTETVVAGGQIAVSINSAAVQINNNNKTAVDSYVLSSDAKKAGIDEAHLLKPNDAIKVTGDSDGFTAVYTIPTATQLDDNEVVTFNVNDAKISVHAGDVDLDLVTVVAGSDNQVTVQGIEGNAVVTVDAVAGTVYHFKNELSRNTVTVNSANAFVEVTLTSGGDVMKDPVAGRVDDLIDDVDKPAVQADQDKWDAIGVVGKSPIINPTDYDTVESHHAKVYENFYDLVNSAVSGNTVAGFENPDDENPTEGSSNINISGESPLGNPAPVGEAVHVTLSGNAAVGSVPINIQKDESTNVKDVTIALGNASVPSTVAVGTIEQRDANNNVVPVKASHNIQLSNAGTQNSPSYGYLGQYATGQNVLSGGTGNNMLRHDGENRTSIYGGASNDTIRGDVNDVVSGGLEADYFYDLSGYALDYNVAEGDVIIASRLANLGEVTQANIWGQGNQVAFGNHGEYYLTLGNINPNAAVHVKVATMDDDGNIMKGVKDVVLANGNGLVDATAAGDNGALIIADSTRGNGVHAVAGSTGNDTIHSGAFDTVNGGAGNDDIYIENGASAAGAVVVLGGGDDSVTGWTFGFDRAAGATQLDAGGLQVVGRVFEDRMYVSLVGGDASISFNDTAALGNSDTATMHGQYDILVDNTKYTMIRNGDARTGYAIVDSNDKIADYYMAEREGEVHFTSNVTDLIGDKTRFYSMGFIDLTSENFHAIRNLDLQNNSKTVVYGSTGRETVTTGGQAVLGANKFVSLGADNDVIISGGDDNPSVASNAFFFGAGDGRDTIMNFNHYQGVNEDPDKQSADLIVLQSFAGVKSEVDANGVTRVEFALSADTAANEYALIYEAPGTYDYNKNMYRVQITDTGSEGIAKIGYSTVANAFTYDKEVSYYVGSSGEARDTLIINTVNENVEVRMDGQKQDGKFYRGIGAIDASAAAYTNTTLAGSAADNLIVSGGEGTNNFLWGGAGSNTLIGGAGKDFFLYTKNANAYVAGADHSDTSGTNDIVLGYDCNNDVIILSDVTLADINYAAMAQASGHSTSDDAKKFGITENAVTVALNNGGSVTVDPTGQSNVTFYINDGAGNLRAFTANRETGAWS